MPINHSPIKEEVGSKITKEVKKFNDAQFYLVDPRNTFDDIILSEKVQGEITNYLSLVKNKDLIFDRWGLSTVIKHCNYNINLYGESGTGKTLTANAIAYALNKKITIVNYSEIESKYVGETAKNLVSLFRFAKINDSVILFDEADALLSKRVTAMNSATDVSVNQTRNVLLKILDDYTGIVIFTTNFIQNFDPAFMRRIFTHIKFDLPDLEIREKLWRHYLVETLPIVERENVIRQICFVENVTGADISIAVLKSAVEAANRGPKSIDYDLLLNTITDVIKHKAAVTHKIEYTSREVSKEYIDKEYKGTENGNNKRNS